MSSLRIVALACLIASLAGVAGANNEELPEPPASKQGIPTHGRAYGIEGLPQSDYTMDVVYEHGTLTPLECAGSVGFIVAPKGEVDAQRRWVWISNLFLALNDSASGPVRQRYYIENLLAHGFHIVGIDVGASCGSPAGAQVYEQFYRMLIDEYKLNPRARMIGQSNGGLITYGFAFRHPDKVDRVMGICPATDFTSWPGWDRLCGPGDIVPAGLSYGLSREEMEARVEEFNPIDNIAPLVAAGVKAYHIHGTHDDIVPLDPNSAEFARRYRELGGDIQVEVIENGTHGGPSEAFFESPGALKFLLE